MLARSVASLALVAGSLAVSSAFAAGPHCAEWSGCLDPGDSHDIGGGTHITLPSGWESRSYPMPPDVPESTNLRIRRPGMTIAITGFPPIEGAAERAAPTLADYPATAGKPYASLSVEGDRAVAVAADGKNGPGRCVSYTAPTGQRPFKVLRNQQSASVTSCLLVRHDRAFFISLMSDNAPDADYAAAVEAIRHID